MRSEMDNMVKCLDNDTRTKLQLCISGGNTFLVSNLGTADHSVDNLFNIIRNAVHDAEDALVDGE